MAEQPSIRSALSKYRATPNANTLNELLSATSKCQDLSAIVANIDTDTDKLLSDVAALAGIIPVIAPVDLVGVIGQAMWIANSAIALVEEYRADALLTKLVPEDADNEPAS